MFRKLLCLFLIALAVSGFAQNAAPPKPAPKKRARIGVALEGGSAFGLAHIGVLQWFDEHHIPVDYIAGTSMGGLVGRFYATGMSPEDLNQLDGKTGWGT